MIDLSLRFLYQNGTSSEIDRMLFVFMVAQGMLVVFSLTGGGRRLNAPFLIDYAELTLIPFRLGGGLVNSWVIIRSCMSTFRRAKSLMKDQYRTIKP